MESSESLIEILRERLEDTLDCIDRAALRSGRDPQSVKLVVVTKSQPVECIQAVIQAGAKNLGENYADEALNKMIVVGQNPPISWHMIGHVQSRKAGKVCDSFDYFHALDSLKLADKLNRLCEERKRKLPVLLECNLAGEASKFGWPIDNESLWVDLLPVVEKIITLPALEVHGLMGMAPFFSDPEPSRPCFIKLRKFRDYLSKKFPDGCWDELSMGMSGDFEPAVEEGATWVRIGTRIMGQRQ
jgi:pyridoxal phosphate enzyme (YggS family)